MNNNNDNTSKIKCCSNNNINNKNSISNNNNNNINNNSNTITTPTEQITSFYKRELPSHLIEFSSDEGKSIFKEALLNGHMECYFSLAEQFLSQSDPAFCGLATLSMVLNALKIDPNRLWKGPWRWFVDDMLDCCIPIETVRKRGITFTEFSCLAKCNGVSVRSYRGDETLDLDQFRNDIIKISSNNNNLQEPSHLVLSYARKTLGQTGSGHYSPIGGYHKEKDLALVLDVARFKYSPHWVPVETLWESMKLIDPDTNKPRGYYILSKNKSFSPSFYQIKITLKWSEIIQKYLSTINNQLNNIIIQDYKQIIELLFKHLPTETPYILCSYSYELQKQLNNTNNNSINDNNNSNNNNNNNSSSSSSSSNSGCFKSNNKINNNNNNSTTSDNSSSTSNGCCKANNNNNDNNNNNTNCINMNRWQLFFQDLTINSKSYPVLKEMIQDSRIHWKMSNCNDSIDTGEFSDGEMKEMELCSHYQNQIATFLFLSFPNSIFNSLNQNQNNEIINQLSVIRNLNNLNRNVKDEVLKAREELFFVKSDDECECSINCKL